MGYETHDANGRKSEDARIALRNIEEAPGKRSHKANPPDGGVDQPETILHAEYAENIRGKAVAAGNKSYQQDLWRNVQSVQDKSP